MGAESSKSLFVPPQPGDEIPPDVALENWQKFSSRLPETISSKLQNGTVFQIQIHSRWTYRRGFVGLDQDATRYWTKGDRFNFVSEQQSPDQGTWDAAVPVEYEGDDDELSPSDLFEAGASPLMAAVDWEDNVDESGCLPGDAAISFLVDGCPISRASLNNCVHNGGCRVVYSDNGPLASGRSEANCTIEEGGTDFENVETILDTVANENDCTWSGEYVCEPDGPNKSKSVLDLNPALLTFHITRWHSSHGQDVSQLLTHVEYDGKQLQGDCYWDTAEGCQGGTAAIIQRLKIN